MSDLAGDCIRTDNQQHAAIDYFRTQLTKLSYRPTEAEITQTVENLMNHRWLTAYFPPLKNKEEVHKSVAKIGDIHPDKRFWAIAGLGIDYFIPYL